MMKRLTLALVAGGLMAIGGSAYAQDACTQPTAPAAVDGSTATMDELMAAKKGVTDFMAASDAYQTCLLDGVSAQREAAKKAKTKFDNDIAKAADAKISANQAEKVATGKMFNEAVKAYKAAHPA